MKRMALVSLFLLLAFPVFAEDTLASWAANIGERDVQQRILIRIFDKDIGPASEAILNKDTGVYLFPKGGFWVRLGQDLVYGKVDNVPYLVVSCMFYNRQDKPPTNASSYLFRDTLQRPMAISDGYASQEQVHEVKLPMIKKTFLVMIDSSRKSGPTQWSAFLLVVQAMDRPQLVWNSPMSARTFQFGFDALGGSSERLVFRAFKGEEVSYSAWRWNGDRFEIDGFASERLMKALPEEAWRYGTPPAPAPLQ